MTGEAPFLVPPPIFPAVKTQPRVDPITRTREHYLSALVDPARRSTVAALMEDNPVGQFTMNAVTKAVEVGITDPLVGIYNLISGDRVPYPDIKAALNAGITNAAEAVGIIKGDRSFEELYREHMEREKQRIAQETYGIAGRLSEGAGNVVGFVGGLMGPGVSSGIIRGTEKALTPMFTKAFDKIAQTRLAQAAPGLVKATGRTLAKGAPSAVGFGVREAIVQEGEKPPEERSAIGALEIGTQSALLWEGFTVVNAIARATVARLLKRPDSAGGPEPRVMEALGKFARKEKFEYVPGLESEAAYWNRLVDSFVQSGMPGLNKMTWQQLAAPVVSSVIEGFGLSMLDMEFNKDFFGGIWGWATGDPEADKKVNRALEQWASTALGLGALKAGGRLLGIPEVKRNERLTEEDVQGLRVREMRTEPEVVPRLPEPAPEARQKPQEAPKGEPPREGRALQEGVEQPPAAAQRPHAALRRMGWEWDPQSKSYKLESSQGATIRYLPDGTVQLSPRLRGILNIKQDEPIPPEMALELAEKVTLLNHMQAKALLPGVEIDVNGTKVIPTENLKVPSTELAVRFGQVFSRPFLSDDIWKLVPNPPEPPRAQLDQGQRQLVAQLQDWRKMLPVQPDPLTGVVMDQAVRLLGTLPRASNPAVDQALQMVETGTLGQAIQAAGGDPERMARVLTEFAHVLVDKAPQLALEDMQQALQTQPYEVTQQEFMEGTEGVERARKGREHRLAVRKALEEGRAVPTAVRQEFEAAEGEAKEAASRKAESEGKGPSVVYGGIPLGPLESLGRAATNLVSKILEDDVAPLISRVASRGEPRLAEKAHEVVRRFKKNRGLLNNQWADYAKMLRSLAGMRSTHNLHARVTDGNSLWTTYHLAMDEKAGEHLGFDRDSLPPHERKLIGMAHDLNVDAMRLMEAAEAPMANRPNATVRANPNRWRMVRHFTPAMREAMLLGHGPLFEMFVAEMSRLHGEGMEPTRRKIDAMREMGLIRRDATEFARVFDLMPDALRMKDGHVVEILEAHPYANIKAVIDHAALRAAYGSVFGWDVQIEGEDVPIPSRDVVKAAAPEAQQAVIEMLRALNGLPIEAPIRWLRPGTREYDGYLLMRAYLAAWRGLKMTRSFLVNIPELAGAPATYLGGRRVMAAIAQASSLLARGEIMGKIRDLAQKGIITREVLDYSVTGGGAEKALDVGKLVGSVATIPFRFVQEYMVELPMALAIESAVADMRAGNGGYKLRGMLHAMEFDQGTAEAMLRGEGRPEDYDRFSVNAVNFLGGGTTGQAAEKSRHAQANVWKRLIFFADFFRARMNQFRRLLHRFRDAKTGKDYAEAMGMLLRYMGYGAIAGSLASTLVQLIKNGFDGPVQLVRAWWDDPEEWVWNAVVGALFGGTGGVVLGAVMDPRSEDEGLGDALMQGIAPWIAGKELAEFAAGIAPNFGGPEPDSTNRYAGMSVGEKIGTFLQTLAPLARDASEGLFGMAVLALSSDDPDLDEALDAYYQWKRKHIGFSETAMDEERAKQSGQDMEKVRQFRTAMKKVMRLVREGHNRVTPEIREALIEAIKAKDWEAVHQSLRVRRLFDSDWTKLTPEQRESMTTTLGDDYMRRLRAYDRTIELLADWVK